MVPPINLILYPLGVAIVWWYVAPMISSCDSWHAASSSTQRIAASRAGYDLPRRSLIGVALWVVAGIASPPICSIAFIGSRSFTLCCDVR
jgi:hypothetical protein